MGIPTRSALRKSLAALGTGAFATGMALAPAGTASAHESEHHGEHAKVSITQTNLISDQALPSSPNVLVDPTLVNPWGMSFGTGASASPLWVSDNGSEASTLYKNAATPPALTKVPLTVTTPMGPTGQVFNPSATEFVVTAGAASGAAKFIFASESGWIAGWNPNVPAASSTQATPAVHVPNAVFKGLTLASAHGADYLYAADFSNGRVDVFNSSFVLQHWVGAFRDHNVPSSYAPFNVQVLNGKLYVTYAKKNPGTIDDLAGAGHGFVDVFDTSGHLVKRLVQHGALNSPWGLAIAPSSWGALAGDLLVGNFGNGRIHVYNANNGHPLGALRDAHHHVIAIDGLWGLLPGNGVASDPGSVIFTAGPDDEAHGLLGVLTAVVAAPHS